jgi:6-pyruvoyltetrahydropterin/6-carboxytetrahydropterin synthase
MRTTICKRFAFEAAHVLRNHNGKCGRLHGHSYVVEVEATGPVRDLDGASDEGMVLDFARLKELWAPMHEALDHANLNEVLIELDEVTTAERLAGMLLDWLRSQDERVCAVRVHETTGAWAEARL